MGQPIKDNVIPHGEQIIISKVQMWSLNPVVFTHENGNTLEMWLMLGQGLVCA